MDSIVMSRSPLGESSSLRCHELVRTGIILLKLTILRIPLNSNTTFGYSARI